jgi:hypothetical protein
MYVDVCGCVFLWNRQFTIGKFREIAEIANAFADLLGRALKNIPT